ncbi:MAG TPA: hypothetical protein VFX63_11650 [Pyrinomonadaceae bacterium]|nr:hypothetical protein [Pyrinomonadaceae bacterium]
MTNAPKKQLESPEVLNWLTLKFADWLEVLPDELELSQLPTWNTVAPTDRERAG